MDARTNDPSESNRTRILAPNTITIVHGSVTGACAKLAEQLHRELTNKGLLEEHYPTMQVVSMDQTPTSKSWWILPAYLLWHYIPPIHGSYPESWLCQQVHDSKELSEAERRRLSDLVDQKMREVGCGSTVTE